MVKVQALVLAIVLFIDQVSKWWVFQRGGGVINEGGVFGILPSVGWLYVLMGIWIWLLTDWLKKKKADLASFGVGLIIVGGLSNLLDRVFFGGVRDFIYYPWLNLHGNIADIALFIGVVLITLTYERGSRNLRHET